MMKALPRFLTPALLAVAFAAAPAVHAQEADAGQLANAAYAQAIAAENACDAATAKAAYEKALQLNPRHANARHRLGQLHLNYSKIESKGREKKFSAVVISEFRVNNADFSEALGALAQLTEKASKEDVTPNFIIQDPTNILGARKVTLVMKGAPAGGILGYLLEMAKAKARFDEHAVVIMPR
jgi:tetratricopeptide (TPR) repeat protein